MATQKKRSSTEVALEKMKEDYRRVKANGGIQKGTVSRKKGSARSDSKKTNLKPLETYTPNKPDLKPIETYTPNKPNLKPIETYVPEKPNLQPIKPRYSSRVTKPNEKKKFYM